MSKTLPCAVDPRAPDEAFHAAFPAALDAPHAVCTEAVAAAQGAADGGPGTDPFCPRSLARQRTLEDEEEQERERRRRQRSRSSSVDEAPRPGPSGGRPAADRCAVRVGGRPVPTPGRRSTCGSRPAGGMRPRAEQGSPTSPAPPSGAHPPPDSSRYQRWVVSASQDLAGCQMGITHHTP